MLGALTLRIRSDFRAASVPTKLAPSFEYSLSWKAACSPAPYSILTLKPTFISRWAASGLRATLLSLAQVSFGTPMVTYSTGFPKVAKYLKLLACMITDLMPIWVCDIPLFTYKKEL